MLPKEIHKKELGKTSGMRHSEKLRKWDQTHTTGEQFADEEVGHHLPTVDAPALNILLKAPPPSIILIPPDSTSPSQEPVKKNYAETLITLVLNSTRGSQMSGLINLDPGRFHGDLIDQTGELMHLREQVALLRRNKAAADRVLTALQFMIVGWDGTKCLAKRCGKEIPIERRSALPGAKLCASCKGALEQNLPHIYLRFTNTGGLLYTVVVEAEAA